MRYAFTSPRCHHRTPFPSFRRSESYRITRTALLSTQIQRELLSEHRPQARKAERRFCTACQAALTKAGTPVPSEASSTGHSSKADGELVKLDPEALFPHTHINSLDPAFLLYIPFGAGLAIVRIFLWVVLLLIDQEWLTDNDASIAFLQAILGVQAEWKNADLIPRERHVLVSNHVTTGDLMMLYCRPQRIVHLISTALPQRVAQANNHRVDLRHACLETYTELVDGIDSIHLFPEGGMTNGKGMMKFSRGFLKFAEDLPIVPVALRAELPWNISTHTLTSSFLSNLFWIAANETPDICDLAGKLGKLSLSDQMLLLQGEGKAKFVERIQQEIADELQIPILDLTIQAKKKMMQAVLRNQS